MAKLGEVAGFNLMDALKRAGADMGSVHKALEKDPKPTKAKPKRLGSKEARKQMTSEEKQQRKINDLIRNGAPLSDIQAAQGYVLEPVRREPKAPIRISDSLIQAIIEAGGDEAKIKELMVDATIPRSIGGPVTSYNVKDLTPEELAEKKIDTSLWGQKSDEDKMKEMVGVYKPLEESGVVDLSEYQFTSQKKLALVARIWPHLMSGKRVTVSTLSNDNPDLVWVNID